MEGLASTGAATAESIVQQGNVVRQPIKPRFEGVVVMLTLEISQEHIEHIEHMAMGKQETT